MSRLRRWTVMVPLVVLPACGPPRPLGDPNAASCTEERLAECEAALLAAEAEDLPELLAAYAAARGEPAYETLFEALRRAPDQALLLGDLPEAPETLARAPLPPPPKHVPLDALLLALGRAAGHAHLIVADGAAPRQIFPTDVLAHVALGLEPVVAADPRRLVDDVALASTIRDVLGKASSFDYVAAARGAETMSRQLASRGHGDEAALRARYAQALLDSAGILLTVEEPDAVPAERSTGFASMSTPYGSLLALILSAEDRVAAYERHAPAILPHLTRRRADALEQLWGRGDACPTPFAPPLDGLDDLFFARQLMRALDRQAAPGEEPAPGKLTLTDWLPKYDRLVELVAEHGLGWSHASLLV
ncbi:MAG TPA: hypothetical protein ENK57_15335, partial [Polyangiaceae bacterium]|nr:hypothetical protein [Polyangiaceae bacterium]